MKEYKISNARIICTLEEDCMYAEQSYSRLIWDGERYRCYGRQDCSKVTPTGRLTGWLKNRLHPFKRMFIERAIAKIKTNPDPLPELTLIKENGKYYVKYESKFIPAKYFASNWFLLDIKGRSFIPTTKYTDTEVRNG